VEIETTWQIYWNKLLAVTKHPSKFTHYTKGKRIKGLGNMSFFYFYFYSLLNPGYILGPYWEARTKMMEN